MCERAQKNKLPGTKCVCRITYFFVIPIPNWKFWYKVYVDRKPVSRISKSFQLTSDHISGKLASFFRLAFGVQFWQEHSKHHSHCRMPMFVRTISKYYSYRIFELISVYRGTLCMHRGDQSPYCQSVTPVTSKIKTVGAKHIPYVWNGCKWGSSDEDNHYWCSVWVMNSFSWHVIKGWKLYKKVESYIKSLAIYCDLHELL